MKQVLITGAARRIGRVVALRLARAGWDVHIHFRSSAAQAQTLAAEIRSLGRQASLIQADFEKGEDIENLTDVILSARAASPDDSFALVHNACLFERDENDPTGERHLRANLNAPLFLTECLFASLPEGGTVSETSALFLLDGTPLPPFLSAYAASREALRQALPALAARMAPRLRIKALVLGPTLKAERQSEAHFAALAAACPKGRATTPDEVASSVLSILERPVIAETFINL